MEDITYTNTTDPDMKIDINFSSSRNKDKVTVTAKIVEKFVNEYGYGWLGTGWTLTFYMTIGSQKNSVVIKDKNSWENSKEHSRTRYCSLTFTSTSNTATVKCEILGTLGYTAGTMPSRSKTISISSFSAPTAPTWISINPNPCNVNSRPIITWGGAKAGSMGVLQYDLQIRSTKPSGAWTDWVSLLAATSGTSYTNPVLNSMNISGQPVFYGVKYQYRVRSWDGTYTNSVWLNSSELQVGFVAPSPPSSFTWGSTSVKKGDRFSVSWSGASGGSGSISKYQAQFLYYTKATGAWTNVGIIYTGSSASCSGSLATLFPNAKNGDRITVRVQTYNSWGVWSTANDAPSLPIRANQIWIKINGAWVEGDCYIKSNGTWSEGMPYVKSNGAWKEST